MMAVVGLKMCGSPSISGGDEFKYEVLERGSTERFDFEFICMALDLTQQRSCVNSWWVSRVGNREGAIILRVIEDEVDVQLPFAGQVLGQVSGQSQSLIGSAAPGDYGLWTTETSMVVLVTMSLCVCAVAPRPSGGSGGTLYYLVFPDHDFCSCL